MLEKARVENIQKWLETIDTYNATEGDGTTRVLFTDQELVAREYVKNEMKKIGLQVIEDSIGNLFGVLEGSNKELAPVWTGSHIDTVLNAGMFDGMAGVVGGMEALRIIKASGIIPQRTLMVVVYTSEEPTRFGLSCLGSRAMAGKLSLEKTKSLYDKAGKSLYEVLSDLGYTLDEFEKIKMKQGDVFGAIELHIEQNNILESKGIRLGIVDSICAPTNFEVRITGRQSHAGGTSMKDRRDAFAATCEIGCVLERLTRAVTDSYVTGTIGRVQVVPNAVNVIPGFVQFSIDIRSDHFEAKNKMIEKLMAQIKRIEKEREVTIEVVLDNHDVPIKCNENLVDIIETTCEDLNIPSMHLVSGAYHDSLFVGEFAPIAMIFVPSKNGISHSADEWTDFADIALGTDVLAQVMLKLAI